MGVMSRRILPLCGGLCFFCPSLRPRSRQPLKRYKMLLEDAFPKPKDAEPNVRMISKLSEYVSKNPIRIPKITTYLEQRLYKELRNEHFSRARVVPFIYRGLLASCKEHMSLYASSLLSVVWTLLEQKRHNEMRILGCHTLIDFLDCQVDNTYMFKLEGFISELCQLSREFGSGDMALRVRSAGLQALSCLVQFMGSHSHITNGFDEIVSVTLENYVHQQKGVKYDQKKLLNLSRIQWRRTFEKSFGQRHSSFGAPKKIQSCIDDCISDQEAATEKSKSPMYWTMMCLRNMAQLAKEATAVRRVLEPVFHMLDNEEYWSPDKGIAYSILLELQNLMEKSGVKNHFLISLVIKHLDHKNIINRLDMEINILKVVTSLTKETGVDASSVLMTAISDLIKRLRKCMQYAIQTSNLGCEGAKQNSILHSTLEECLLELMKKAGDVGPILDMMAIILDNIPYTKIGARLMISSAHRAAQIAVSIPFASYCEKAFPDILFHQLLLAMAHPDDQTRVGSHRVLSVLLVPSAIFPWSVPLFLDSPMGCDPAKTLMAAVSGFSSPTTMLDFAGEKRSSMDISIYKNPDVQLQETGEKSQDTNDNVKRYMVSPSCSVPQIVQLTQPCAVLNGVIVSRSGEKELPSLRLTSQQVGLLLSSIWFQATSNENTPSNYEALALSFKLALLFSRSKPSSYSALIGCFQLAFSLWSFSHIPENSLQPSRRRSLVTLASAMIIFSAKAADLPQLMPSIKELIRDKMVDPYLHLVEDSMLQAFYYPGNAVYDSADDIAATRFLAAVDGDDGKLRRMFTTHLLKKLRTLSEEAKTEIKLQLQQEFSPDDTFLFGILPSHGAETPYSSPAISPKVPLSIDGVVVPSLLQEKYLYSKASGSLSEHYFLDSATGVEVLSANQLIELVTNTTHYVTTSPVASLPISYDQMKMHCEATALEKQKKVSAFLNFK